MTKEEFKLWRLHLNLTVRQMAKYIGASEGAVYRWENGTRQLGGPELKLIGMLQTVERIYPDWHRKLIREAVA